jgi:CRISPR-associated exonuclease Cas4
MMEYNEEDYLMLSGIQHFAFCRRQWALIHIEQQWLENEHTVAGELLHKNAHDPYFNEKRNDVIVSRAMPVFSRTMGVCGECDIVEFKKAADGIPLHGHRGLYQVYPVEYKKGSPKYTQIDILQLTAQAMCLEEMLSTEVEEGAVFYGEIRRRENIVFTGDLKVQVRSAFEEMHQLYGKVYTPKVKWSKACNACSLKEACMPKLGKTLSVKDYIHSNIAEDCS